MPNSDIATLLAALVAAGLGLQSAVGPVVMYVTEAIKDATKPKAGLGGLIALGVSLVLGIALGALTAAVTPHTSYAVYAGFGAIAGMFMASGAVSAHKAAGSVNTDASTAINMAAAVPVYGSLDTVQHNWESYPDMTAEPEPEPIETKEDDGVPDVEENPTGAVAETA